VASELPPEIWIGSSCFHRVVSSPSLGGLGLGVYIVNEIVDVRAGSIGVESKRGAGLRSIVDLPTMSPRHGKALAPEIEGTR
jgi:signal transduction histidine kinase